MMNQNAFFRVLIKEDGTYLELIAAKNAGNKFAFAELDEYLQKLRIEYDKVEVAKAVNNLTDNVVLKLSGKKILPECERLKVDISDDRSVATGRFYPPTNNGSLMKKEDIISELVKSGVKFGAVEENINEFLNHRVYCTDIPLAKAMPVVQGYSASIQYFFNTDPTQLPKKNEDGSVDFHKLDTISHVEKDQLLATLTPAEVGKPGIDVCGSVMQPAKVEKKTLKYGDKVRISEDGLHIYSETNGHVTLAGDRVFVSNVYEIKGDVDASTGDITYDGNVTIKGSVRTGYKIVAKGDIIIEGVVEGAELIADGQIVLKRGIQGMGKGLLKSKSNIIAKFIENATVESEGYLSTDSIMHSKVSAKLEINVDGKRGFITGGEIHSGSRIKVKTAGSTMGTATLLEVGADPEKVEEYRMLEKELQTIPTEIENIDKMLLVYAKKIRSGEKMSPDKVLYIKTATKQKEMLGKRNAEINERLAELTQAIEENEHACIEVRDTIYPGCKVIICNISYYIRKEIIYSRFKKENADIVVIPY